VAIVQTSPLEQPPAAGSHILKHVCRFVTHAQVSPAGQLSTPASELMLLSPMAASPALIAAPAWLLGVGALDEHASSDTHEHTMHRTRRRRSTMFPVSRARSASASRGVEAPMPLCIRVRFTAPHRVLEMPRARDSGAME
jgi:hypothetical protein